MAISTTHLKRCDLISLNGRYDSDTAHELEEAIAQAMGNDVFRIVLDMSETEHFGSAAIRALVMGYKQCRRWNRGDIRLANVPGNILHVLELAGIAPLMQVFDDTTLAVGSF